eukprot:CAMPEP_0119037164 /NCGR_PEP_ID=MMETSP1177-20130426/5345_1 /TAXON_ID=2985 /ORGANISM="Ochromonas sp, Strain CCMP1899" /LENGTH=289 /DNA_ID=CAMNT_0006998041 /DNA_START=143 /DNA_END=1009 /DNA_ORIENTATION=-
MALQTLRRLNTLEETPTVKKGELLASTSSNQLNKLGTETTSPTWGHRPPVRRPSNIMIPITGISLRSGSMSPLGISRNSSPEFLINDSSRKVGIEVESPIIGDKVSPVGSKASPIGSRRNLVGGSRSPVIGDKVSPVESRRSSVAGPGNGSSPVETPIGSRRNSIVGSRSPGVGDKVSPVESRRSSGGGSRSPVNGSSPGGTPTTTYRLAPLLERKGSAIFDTIGCLRDVDTILARGEVRSLMRTSAQARKSKNDEEEMDTMAKIIRERNMREERAKALKNLRANRCLW